MPDDTRSTSEQWAELHPPAGHAALPGERQAVEAVNDREGLLLEAQAVSRRCEGRLREAVGGGDNAVTRMCSQCRKGYTPGELSREESKGMEAERRAMGSQGEPYEAFRRRRGEPEAAITGRHGDGVDVVLGGQ